MKRSYNFIILALIVCILVVTFPCYSFYYEEKKFNNYMDEIEGIEDYSYYSISSDEFMDLINPKNSYSIDSFFDNKINYEYHFYNYYNNRYYYTLNEVCKGDNEYEYFSSDFCDGISPMGFLCVNIKENILNRDNIEKYLYQNGIHDKLIWQKPFYVYNIYDLYLKPYVELMILVKTDNSYYILCSTIEGNNDYSEDIFVSYNYSNSRKERFGFCVYNFDEIYKKYKWNMATIFVNDVKLPYNEKVKCLNENIQLSLNNILNDLGAEIEILPVDFSAWYDSDINKLDYEKPDDFCRVILENKHVDIFSYWTGWTLNENEIIANDIIESEDGDLYCGKSTCGKILYRIGYYLDYNSSKSTVYVNKIVNVYVNGQKCNNDGISIISNNRTLVPMRAIFEELGAEVEWENETQTATATKDGIRVSVTIDSNKLQKNGEEIELDVPARLVEDSRTLVPLRTISEAFGCQVEWDEELQRVDIYTN